MYIDLRALIFLKLLVVCACNHMARNNQVNANTVYSNWPTFLGCNINKSFIPSSKITVSGQMRLTMPRSYLRSFCTVGPSTPSSTICAAPDSYTWNYKTLGGILDCFNNKAKVKTAATAWKQKVQCSNDGCHFSMTWVNLRLCFSTMDNTNECCLSAIIFKIF